MQLKKLYILFLLLFLYNRIIAQQDKFPYADKIYTGIDSVNATLFPVVSKEILFGYNQFKYKSTFTIKDSVVTFLLRNRPEAKKVFLSGSFCNWSPNALPMLQTGNGWFVKIKLNPGKYWYKFIVDDNWELDNNNLLDESDPMGHANSVYFVTNNLFTLPSWNNSKRVYLAGSFNNWKKEELFMQKTSTGWELPLYLADGTHSYQFNVDNKWYPDPHNTDENTTRNGTLNSVISIGNKELINTNTSFQKELLIYEKSGDKNKMAAYLVKLGQVYEKLSAYSYCINYYKKAVKLYEELNDAGKMADINFRIAEAYHNLADFPNELDFLLRSINGYEHTNNETGLALAFSNTGTYYFNLPYIPKAVDYFKKALTLYERQKNNGEIAKMLGNLGHASILLKDLNKALDYTHQALVMNERSGDQTGIANNLCVLATYYQRVLNSSMALDYYNKALNIFEQSGNKGGVAEILFGLASLYIEAPDSTLKKMGINPEEKFAKAIFNQKKCLKIFKENGQVSRQIATLYFITETYEKAGRFDSALYYYRQLVDIRDRIIGIEKQKEITRIELKNDYDKKEESLKLAKELTDEKLQKQLLLFTQQQQQLELNKSQLALSNKEKDLQHLAYLKTQADLQNEQLIKQQNEKENQLQSVLVKTLTQDKAISKLNQQRQWNYIVGVFLILGLSALYFLYRYRLRSVRLETQLVKEKAAQEKKETEFQHRLADISMSALRSQMNPHFIFNCLNSIKLYTTQNDTVAATEYLTKFSKLIRLVLENSRNERITLSAELAALELYIEMEAMRFKEKLSYNLQIEKDVESDYIEIPPLLLQPYVENAIWHGLMPKEDGGHIDINVAMRQGESLLKITITDDGIGREAATAISKKNAGNHRSYGMKATAERIDLINQIYKTGASVFVHDLVNEKGQSAGTEVILQIPV